MLLSFDLNLGFIEKNATSGIVDTFKILGKFICWQIMQFKIMKKRLELVAMPSRKCGISYSCTRLVIIKILLF